MSGRNTAKNITKRRQQLTRQLVIEMMDVEANKVSGKEATPGLLSKMMKKLDLDLESADEKVRQGAMDKIIKLLPYVIAKEKSPAVQLNVQNNNMAGNPQVSSGKTTAMAIGTMQEYLKVRDNQMAKIDHKKKNDKVSDIEDAEIVEFEEDGDEE